MAVVGIVALSTGLAEVLYRLTGSTRLSMVFLAGVLVSAVLLGSGPAYFAAGIAFLVYNFYLVDPRFTFSMGSPEDVLTLAVFLAVAMLTGNLTGRIRDEAARAQARVRTTSILFSATREFSATSEEEDIRKRLAHHLATAAKGAAIVREGLRMQSEPADVLLSRDLVLAATAMVREVTMAGHVTHSIEGWRMRALQAGETLLGVAAWRTDAPEVMADEEQTLLDILVDAGAAAILRARLAAAKAEADTRAKTEQLRDALLSSISHDMRTPLAAILVSATSLRRYGATFGETTRDDLASTIEEEAERLDAFVANLLNMTRLEAGVLSIQCVAFNVSEVIDRAIGRRAGRREITVSKAPDMREGAGDPLLFEQALANVIENAVRYTPQDQTIEVLGRTERDRVTIEVLDEGPGVRLAERTRIFEKFFRSPTTMNQVGTGLGLSIARGLLEGMGGTIDAGEREDGKHGLRVVIQVPVFQ